MGTRAVMGDKDEFRWNLGGGSLRLSDLQTICTALNEGKTVVIENSSRDNDLLSLGLALMAHYERMKGQHG